jgi:hypothetical protein
METKKPPNAGRSINGDIPKASIYRGLLVSVSIHSLAADEFVNTHFRKELE